eukprot:5523869-Prymnesium_polylepis.1
MRRVTTRAVAKRARKRKRARTMHEKTDPAARRVFDARDWPWDQLPSEGATQGIVLFGCGEG